MNNENKNKREESFQISHPFLKNNKKSIKNKRKFNSYLISLYII